MLTRKNMRPYQVRAGKFVVRHPHCGLFLDMGLGKTISTLTGIADLIDAGEVERVLLVGPLRVVQGVWRQEARKWQHTRHLTFKLIHGSEQQRINAMNSEAQIHLINVENLTWMLYVLQHYAKRKSFKWPYDMLVVDESGLFKSASSKRFTKLRSMVKRFNRRVILTGKPRPKNLLDLWSQMFIVDQGERLGGTIKRYRERFFSPSGYMGYNYEADEGAEEKISELISPVILTLRKEDHLDLPKVIKQNIMVDLPPKARSMYERMQEEMFLELEAGDVAALNAASLTSKCHQIANGAIYVQDKNDQKTWQAIHDEKLEALKELNETYDGNLLVAYYFKPDLLRLKSLFPKAPVIAECKNARELDRVQREWNDGKHKMMFVHPQGAGHGLNLQHGGNTIVFFSLLWANDPYDQVIQRVGDARQVGLRDHMTIVHILARNTVDELMLLAQEKKYTDERRLIKLLKDYRDLQELLS